MNEASLPIGSISLMENSPFKQSLPKELDPKQIDVDTALRLARDSNNIFSDVGKFLKQRDQINNEYFNKINERCLKQTNLISGSLHEELMNDPSSSHLKIKLLSEFALSKIDKNEKLLNLNGILLLDSQINELKREKSEFSSQLNLNMQLINNILNGFEISNSDNEILKTTFNSNEAINKRLIEVCDLLESKYQILNNQYLLVLSLCYFEDLNLNLNATESESYETEELMSYLASIAVQRNIVLPTPNLEAPRSQWSKDCLDSILSNPPSQSVSPQLKPLTEESKDKEISKLKTALEDLQFAHQYLTKQFQEERNQNSTAMDTHNKKKTSVENQLSESLSLLEKSNQRSILVEHEKNILETRLDEKINELNDLKRQVTNLKIDNLGFVNSNDKDKDLFNGTPPTSRTSFFSPTSPLTGVEVQLDDLNPTTPLTQNDFKFQSPSSSKFNSSLSILRTEFKKLVNEMHTNFEAELTKEKKERKRLENLVKIYEDRNNEIDLI